MANTKTDPRRLAQRTLDPKRGLALVASASLDTPMVCAIVREALQGYAWAHLDTEGTQYLTEAYVKATPATRRVISAELRRIAYKRRAKSDQQAELVVRSLLKSLDLEGAS